MPGKACNTCCAGGGGYFQQALYCCVLPFRSRPDMYDEGLQEALWKASRIRVTQFLDQKQERMEDQGGQPLAEEDDDDDDDGKKPNSGLKKNAIDDCDNNGLHPDKKDGDGDSLTEHELLLRQMKRISYHKDGDKENDRIPSWRTLSCCQPAYPCTEDFTALPLCGCVACLC